jgi:hypothetical protein
MYSFEFPKPKYRPPGQVSSATQSSIAREKHLATENLRPAIGCESRRWICHCLQAEPSFDDRVREQAVRHSSIRASGYLPAGPGA